MALFGRKNAESPDMGSTGVPISQVLAMKAQGMGNNQIANQLRTQGYPLTQINAAITQADIKSAVGPGQDMMGLPPLPEMSGMEGMSDMGMPPLELPEMPPLPDQSQFQNYPPQQQMMQMQQMPQAPMPTPESSSMGSEQLVNELQRVIEEIIEEKWRGVDERIASLDVWKAKLEDKISSIDGKTVDMNKRIDDFSKSVLGQSDEYQKTMSDVNSEMQAVEKIMGKLVPSLSDEIKQLRDVVENLKER
jgi:hypothetical protein